MSCCSGNCGCGANCKCGNGCGGCKMYADLSYSEFSVAATEAFVLGVAPQKTYFEESVASGGENGNGCKCGSNCACNPCNCK